MGKLYDLPTCAEAQRSGFAPLELVEVSHQDKLKSFQVGIKASQAAWPETEKTLARLKQFYPSTAQGFRLKGEAISQAPLRFLCESSEQNQQDSLRRFDSFLALSYCWHNASWEPAGGLGHPEMEWPISSQMVYALLKQRVTSSEGVWIDQCCIDQTDESEKSLAIGSMDLVYRSARKVVVVLEDIWISEQDEIMLQDLFTNHENDDWTPQSENLNPLFLVLHRIVSARWFRRAWCSHELQLGTDFVFLLPDSNGVVELNLDSLEVLYSETVDHVLQNDDLTKMMTESFLSYDFLTRAMNSRDEHVGKSLISAFSDIDLLECSVPTDKVSIAINTANLQLYFTGRDKLSDECRWLLALIALSASDASALCGVEDLLKINDGAGEPSYSWMHWSNDGEDTRIALGPSKLREPSCITTVDQYGITLDLLCFIGFDVKKPSNFSCLCAEYFLNCLSQQVLNKEFAEQPFWLQHNISLTENLTAQRRERQFTMEILACSLDCGIAWMMGQMTFNQTLAEKMQSSLDSEDIDLWPHLRALLLFRGLIYESDLENLSDQEWKSLLQYVYFIIFDRPLGVGSSYPSYGSANSVPRSENQSLVRCEWLDMGTSGKALVALGYGLQGSYRVTIPVALSVTSCVTTRRLWFLQRSDESDRETWVIMEKFKILTLQPIEENAGHVVRMNDQTIV